MIFAATAMVHNMTLVTRNVKHFNIHGLRVMNPEKCSLTCYPDKIRDS